MDESAIYRDSFVSYNNSITSTQQQELLSKHMYQLLPAHPA
jgi:hypothetical protein